MTPNSRSRPPHLHFTISPQIRGMAPPLLIIIAIPILLVLAMSSTATPRASVAASAPQYPQPPQEGQIAHSQLLAQAGQQVPFQAAFAPANGQSMNQPMDLLYQSKDPTSTSTAIAGSDYPRLTFTPDPMHRRFSLLRRMPASSPILTMLSAPSWGLQVLPLLPSSNQLNFQ
jgi:hypothetical protein